MPKLRTTFALPSIRLYGDDSYQPGNTVNFDGIDWREVKARVLAVAETMRGAVASLEILHAGSPIGLVTISTDVGTFTPVGSGHAPLELIEEADKWLHRAKSIGRNLVCAKKLHDASWPDTSETS